MNTEFIPAVRSEIVPGTTASLIPFFGNPEGLIKAYTDTLANVVDSTKATYTRALRAYFTYRAKSGLTNVAPTRAEVVGYKSHLLQKIEKADTREGYSALTVCSYLNAVRGFYTWISAESEGTIPNIAKDIRSPKHSTAHKKQHLEIDRVGALLSYYQERQRPTDLRDFAIVSLLVRTGLRTAELAGANIGDIQFIGNNRVLWIKGKGRVEKDNYVLLTEKAYAPIRAYLSTRPLAMPSDALFISDSNHRARTEGGATTARLTTRTIRNIVREGLDSIGLDNTAFTAHSLRHTTAVMILEAGGRLEDVQAQLRHASPTTSQIYVESFNKNKQLTKIGEVLDSIL